MVGRVAAQSSMQKKDPLGQINIETRFEDKEIQGMSPISPELDFRISEHSDGEDKEKFNKIGIIGMSGNFEQIGAHPKNYEALTDEELDRSIEKALEKQKLLEKEHIYEHENAIHEESQSNYTSEANVSEQSDISRLPESEQESHGELPQPPPEPEIPTSSIKFDVN